MNQDTQSALLLTQDEWDDLSKICEHFRQATAWAARWNAPGAETVESQRALAQRIIEASR